MRISQTGTCRSGFTLLELIVSLFIISLLSALVFPLFSNLGEHRIQADAKRIASLLRYLNDNSISRKETYSLHVVLADGALSWDGPDGEKTEKMKSLSGMDLQSKGMIRDGEVTLFFGPLGVHENVSILLREDDREFSVMLNSSSGRVKIQEVGQ